MATSAKERPPCVSRQNTGTQCTRQCTNSRQPGPPGCSSPKFPKVPFPGQNLSRAVKPHTSKPSPRPQQQLLAPCGCVHAEYRRPRCHKRQAGGRSQTPSAAMSMCPTGLQNTASQRGAAVCVHGAPAAGHTAVHDIRYVQHHIGRAEVGRSARSESCPWPEPAPVARPRHLYT